MTVTSDQVKAARAIWCRLLLSTGTIAEFERGEKRLPFFDLAVIKGIFEAAGVAFTNGGEPEEAFEMSLSPDQIREARRLLGWPLSVLGGKSGLSVTTVSQFENSRRRPSALNVSAIRKVLEDAGVEFNSNGPGVRLRKGK
jgi:hypothetical protein